MKRILFIASLASHIKAFHIPYMKWLKQEGHQVDVAAHCDIDTQLPYCDNFYEIPFSRSPFSSSNLHVYRQLKDLLQRGHFDIVHCHTPTASVLTRLAARKFRKNGLKVMYTAHGFHFFKGAPLKAWLVFYPIEKYLSRFTDSLITINNEDFVIAKNRHFKAGSIHLVPGIGVNADEYVDNNPQIKSALRKKYGYAESDFILFYAAEFIHRKNHDLIIRQLPHLVKHIPEIKILFAGKGELLDDMIRLAKELGVKDHVDFLGFRNDIPNLVKLSDVGVSASRQEGLGINVAEDMFAGLPVVVSIDRGHKEMVIDGCNGFFFDIKKPDQFSERILKLYSDQFLRHEMGKTAKQDITKFSVGNSLKVHIAIYKSILGE